MSNEFFDVPGYEGLYKVNKEGVILSRKRSGSKGKILKQNQDRYGYMVVTLCKNGQKRRKFVHRILASTFLDNYSDDLQVNHKDEDKTNNQVANLEMLTQLENLNYGTRTNRSANTRIKNINNAKTNIAKSVDCYDKNTGDLIHTFASIAQACRELNLCDSHVSKCCKGKLKTHKGYVFKYKDE